MYLHEISIPVSSYEGDEVFHQLLHFITSDWNSPTRRSVLESLELLHNRDKDDPQYDGTWSEAITIVRDCESFPITYHGMIATNHFVEHPKFGRQPISAQTREVVDMRAGIPSIKIEF